MGSTLDCSSFANLTIGGQKWVCFLEVFFMKQIFSTEISHLQKFFSTEILKVAKTWEPLINSNFYYFWQMFIVLSISQGFHLESHYSGSSNLSETKLIYCVAVCSSNHLMRKNQTSKRIDMNAEIGYPQDSSAWPNKDTKSKICKLKCLHY